MKLQECGKLKKSVEREAYTAPLSQAVRRATGVRRSDVPRPSVVVSGRSVRLYARSVAQKLRSTVTNANLPAPHTQPTEPPNSSSRRNVLVQERESDASCRFTRDGYVAVDRAMQKRIRGALKEPENRNRAAFTKAVLYLSFLQCVSRNEAAALHSLQVHWHWRAGGAGWGGRKLTRCGKKKKFVLSSQKTLLRFAGEVHTA
ncbi:hypothetical protein MHYP_G00208930 [Metynnis hypsauchen]